MPFTCRPPARSSWRWREIERRPAPDIERVARDQLAPGTGPGLVAAIARQFDRGQRGNHHSHPPSAARYQGKTSWWPFNPDLISWTHQDSMLHLAPGQIDLWACRHDDTCDEVVVARCRALLSPLERHQEQRFRFHRDRRRYVMTRALLRTTLSRYASIKPIQ